MGLIALSPIEDIVTLTLYSAYLANERPLSLLIISRIEAGKTELLSQFQRNQGVHYLTDCTAFGIAKTLLRDIIEQRIRHLIIPDLLIPFSHSKNTTNNLVALFNALIEEGVIDIKTFYHRGPAWERPVRCGLITAVSREKFEEEKHYWRSLGFLSRCLPVTYEYSVETQTDIRAEISTGVRKQNYILLDFPNEDKIVRLPRDIGERVADDAPRLVDAERYYGFRMQRHLQRLMMSRALLHQRDEVNWEDYRKIKGYTKFINLDFNRL